MAKKIIKQVIIHKGTPFPAQLSTTVTAFYADIIRRRLASSTLSKESKLEALESVTKSLKKRIT